MAGTLGVRHLLIESNELEIEGFSANPPNRCYYCKKELFEKLLDLAKGEGIRFIVEGSNLDDEKDHRPGRAACPGAGSSKPSPGSAAYEGGRKETFQGPGPAYMGQAFVCLSCLAVPLRRRDNA